MPLVTLSEVRKTFRRGRTPVHAVNGVDLHIEAGETLALIGESGSGKSTVGRLALGLIQPDEGHVTVDGMQLDGLDRKTLQAARRNMTIVFQEPFQSLDPLMSVGRIIEEPLVIHEPSLTPTQRRDRVEDTMGAGHPGSGPLRAPAPRAQRGPATARRRGAGHCHGP